MPAPERARARWCLLGIVLTASLLMASLLPAAEEAGRIMRPVDKAALKSGDVEIIATAPDGKLEVDGKPVAAEQPFPKVLQASTKLGPGLHKLALIWSDGRKEISFFVGPNPPSGFAAYHAHPPVSDVKCTQCHELTRRGRFHFKGGAACFECHQRESFAKVHTHTADVLNECGLCHNAHGSAAASHLLYTKEVACKQCHN